MRLYHIRVNNVSFSSNFMRFIGKCFKKLICENGLKNFLKNPNCSKILIITIKEQFNEKGYSKYERTKQIRNY